MAAGLPPLAPMGASLPRPPQAAAEAQARALGGALHTGLQATLAGDRGREERAKQAAQTLAPRTPGGMLMALRGVKRDRRSNDDPRRPRVPEPEQLDDEVTAAD